MSKASRGKRGEASVDAVLQSIPSGTLLSDVTLIDEKNGVSHQIDHIFFHPHGIFVIETKNYRGAFEVDAEGAWLRNSRGETTRIRSPLYQNKGHMKQLKRFLKTLMPSFQSSYLCKITPLTSPMKTSSTLTTCLYSSIPTLIAISSAFLNVRQQKQRSKLVPRA